MNIIAITGKEAYPDVVKAISGKADVLKIDIDVAAFITPSKLSKYRDKLKKYDLVLLPGLVKGNFRKLEEDIGTKIRLGPIHAFDLGMVLDNIDKVELSHEIPACRLLQEFKKNETFSIYDKLKEESKYAFKIRDLKVSYTVPLILAEIVNATEMTKEELSLHIEYFVEEGADMIDIGIPVEIDLERAIQTIRWAVDMSPVPVSIDTLDPKIIEKAIPEGIDLILSVSRDSMDLVPLISKYDVAIVVIEKTGLSDLISTISALRRDGIEKIIADPILIPPGFGLTESICRYRKFRELNPNIPTLMGAGNVSELIDADSQGVNALVASLAIELGVSILLTTEHSPKTTGSVKELKTASVMAAVSRYRNTTPKDLGVDLLIIKEKFKRPEGDMPKKYIKARNSIRFERDPLGDFRIWISNGKIVVSHKKAIIVGDDAKSIISTILEMGLISSLQHASYLGRELMKAELAVRFNRSYMQDDVF